MKDILNHLLKCNLFRNIPLYERKIGKGVFSKLEVAFSVYFRQEKNLKRSNTKVQSK